MTRCAVTTETRGQKQEGGNRTMGRKFTVPYAPLPRPRLRQCQPCGRAERDGILRG